MILLATGRQKVNNDIAMDRSTEQGLQLFDCGCRGMRFWIYAYDANPFSRAGDFQAGPPGPTP